MNTENQPSLKELIVAAAFERHSIQITGEPWIEHISKYVESGEQNRTSEMTAVLQAVALEVQQYVGEIPPDIFDHALQ